MLVPVPVVMLAFVPSTDTALLPVPAVIVPAVPSIVTCLAASVPNVTLSAKRTS